MTVLRDYAASVIQPALGQTAALYDEVASPDGTLRTSWKRLAAEAVDLTLPELNRVGDEITRLLADEGVVYTPPGADQQAWRLDPVPLVIAADEWAVLEKGLAQRAELLNALLVDLYGEQRLLAEGVIPPAVVLGHAGFTRAVARRTVDGTADGEPIDPRPLVFSAVDLGRDAAGCWRVAWPVSSRRVACPRRCCCVHGGPTRARCSPLTFALPSCCIGAAPSSRWRRSARSIFRPTPSARSTPTGWV